MRGVEEAIYVKARASSKAGRDCEKGPRALSFQCQSWSDSGKASEAEGSADTHNWRTMVEG